MSTMTGSRLDRRDAVQKLTEANKDALVVTGLGSPSYDVHATGDRDHHYYLWGAMGSAALVGLGIAQARPDKRVMVITGDGEQLMAFGSLATIAVAKPMNLDVIVLDNEHFGETGMQSSHTGLGINLSSVASACGFSATRVIRTLEGIDCLCEQLPQKADGPRLFVLKIKAGNVPRSLPPRDAVFVKNRFRATIGLAPC